MKFRTCPLCGAALDFGEHCDCQDAKEEYVHPAAAFADRKCAGDSEQIAHVIRRTA